MRACFRVDGGTVIGTGHVFRCLTLAKALDRRGANCTFVSKNLPDGLAELIQRAGHRLLEIYGSTTDAVAGDHRSWLGDLEHDSQQTINTLVNDGISRENPLNFLIVDHYGIDRAWEERLAHLAKHIILIDDLADRKHACSLLIDHNIARVSSAYHGLVEPDTKLLCGLSYALLRPEFAALRNSSISERLSRTRPMRVLVSMGGVDADNFSCVAIDGLELAQSKFPSGSDPLQVDVVLSAIAPHAEEVRHRLKMANLFGRLHMGSDRVHELMARSDLSVGSAGVTTLERLVLGLPALVCANAENQVGVLNHINELGVGMYLGWTRDLTPREVADAIMGLIENPRQWYDMVKASAEQCDGLGCERVCDAILALDPAARPSPRR